MYLKARFSKMNEAPSYPLISHAIKIKKTEEDRIITYPRKLSKDEVKEEVIKHFKAHQGNVRYMGNIKYYDLCEDDKLLYRLNTNGEIIQNDYFLDLIVKFYFSNKSKELQKKIREELKLLREYEDNFIKLHKVIQDAVNKVDPYGLSKYLSEIEYKHEYEPEYRDITLELVKRRNLNKKKIFLVIKKVFEFYFGKDEKDPQYWLIAAEIDKFYMNSRRKNTGKQD